MQKIIIDTNVLISGIIQNGYPNLILHNSLLSDKIEIAISEKLFSEYYQVLHRPKFSKYPDFLNRAEILLAQLKKRSVV